MSKKVFAVILSILIVIISILLYRFKCNNKKNKLDNDVIIIAIYPTAISSETYYFNINLNGKLIASHGTRKSDDITSEKFLISNSIINKQTLYLDQENIEIIIELLNKLENERESLKYYIATDSWDIGIYYNQHSYKINYDFNNDNESVDKLIDMIIDISPIHVDIHGFA